MDKLSKKRRSWNMSRIKSSGTLPEYTLRKYLYKSGFRYRINFPVTGKPDIIFPDKKIAIFVHGCFWHRHGCKNSTTPKTNAEFWKEKLDGNVLRDKKVSSELQKNNWIVEVVWECEIENNTQKTLLKVIRLLNLNGLKQSLPHGYKGEYVKSIKKARREYKKGEFFTHKDVFKTDTGL